MSTLPIHHTFAPHIDLRYYLRTKLLTLMPWKWKKGTETDLLKKELERTFHAQIFLFSSGREGLLALLRSMHLRPGNEVILQAYTCVVLPTAIRTAGCVPIYVDIQQETLNMDPGAVEAAITPRTKLVICQHTFGIPSPLGELRTICDRHGIPLLEDCAHIIPDSSGPNIGTTGDFVLLSFGRDKAISGIAGGAVLSRIPKVTPHISEEEQNAQSWSHLHIFQLLCYPIYFDARPLYDLGVGKALMRLMKKIGCLLPIVTQDEKEGHMSATLHSIPNACAILALAQWQELKRLNDHRRMLTKFYLEEFRKRNWKVLEGIREHFPLQKFPTFVKKADNIREILKRKNIYLDDGWTSCVICPSESNVASANYTPGSDPEAEAACEKILSLPTHPTMTLRQAKKLITELEDYIVE